VRIERHDGEVLSSRQEARAAFFGRAGLRRNLRWDPLDSVYFAGYAMWNYLTFPYLLTRDGVEVSDGDTWPEGGETWRRLDASFPPDIDTHSRRQTFYVDAGGRLRRHDYVPEVIGRWARSAHYCADHVQAGGLLFPTRRNPGSTGGATPNGSTTDQSRPNCTLALGPASWCMCHWQCARRRDIRPFGADVRRLAAGEIPTAAGCFG
jgi:hypothetical protein